MNIGFVTTWLERGATHVTKTYMNLLEDCANLYVFARGGEYADKDNSDNSIYNITWGLRLQGTNIDWNQFSRWIEVNNLDIVFFNEQSDLECLYKIKIYYPKLIIGSYIDYYKESTVDSFKIYDFLICNTKKHYSVFKWHPNVHYVPWGTDLDLFKPMKSIKGDELVFFHSMGMSPRKGTSELIKAFIEGEFHAKRAKLIIHSQIKIDHLISKEQAKKHNIEIIVKEVPPPGLYHLGDVYVYPTTLDGLGLTMYEALASGLPVITTNDAPMNEIINSKNGRLVDVETYRCRADAYYWPLAIVDRRSLIRAMQYYLDNRENIVEFKKSARSYAENRLNIKGRKENVIDIFVNAQLGKHDKHQLKKELNTIKKRKNEFIFKSLIEKIFPNCIKHSFREILERKRRNEKI